MQEVVWVPWEINCKFPGLFVSSEYISCDKRENYNLNDIQLQIDLNIFQVKVIISQIEGNIVEALL